MEKKSVVIIFVLVMVSVIALSAQAAHYQDILVERSNEYRDQL